MYTAVIEEHCGRMRKMFLKNQKSYKDVGVHFSHLLSYPTESHPDFKEKCTAVTFH